VRACGVSSGIAIRPDRLERHSRRMSEDLSWLSLGDQVAALAAELEERVSLDPETRRVVLTALAVAANNGRVIGANEVIAQAVQTGTDLRLHLVAGEPAPSTLAEALGDA
jgi:hypothetical protein